MTTYATKSAVISLLAAGHQLVATRRQDFGTSSLFRPIKPTGKDITTYEIDGKPVHHAVGASLAKLRSLRRFISRLVSPAKPASNATPMLPHQPATPAAGQPPLLPATLGQLSASIEEIRHTRPLLPATLGQLFARIDGLDAVPPERRKWAKRALARVWADKDAAARVRLRPQTHDHPGVFDEILGDWTKMEGGSALWLEIHLADTAEVFAEMT